MPTTVSLTGVAIPKGLPRRRIAPLPNPIIFFPFCCAWPGARIEAPKPPTTPTARRSAPSIGAAISGDPRPFWMVWTIVSGPSNGTQDCAAASTSNALVGNDDEIAGPDSVGRRGGMNGHRAIAAGAFPTQAPGPPCLGMIGPERDGVNLMTGVNHQRGIDPSHCATADHRNLC